MNHHGKHPRKSPKGILRHRQGTPIHATAHHKRGIMAQFSRIRGAGIGAVAAFLAVLGPGLLAGLSDDDPAGITTYSILGADFGYRLLWIIPASTLLLIQFHLMAVRIGAVTGKGFAGIIRTHWGRNWGYAAALGLLFANFGTICAEYAGIAAACGLVGIPGWMSAPIACMLISAMVVFGSFYRIERVLLIISSTLALYIVAAVLAAPDWQAVWENTLIPNMPESTAGWIAIAAALGTTLAPWGLAFIQSYAVDKKITVANLRWEKVDVVIGSVLTGVIGMAIAVACAATLYRSGIQITDAGDAALALQPLAGRFATIVFGAGLLGASLLAAAIVPLATAYTIAEGIGAPASLDLDSRHFQLFYAAFIGLSVAAASVVAIPGLPLIPMIYSSQVVNAVLLPLHLIALQLLASDKALMGDAHSDRNTVIVGWISIFLVFACIAALTMSWLGSS
jgi:Mn2+/Fe2+ NRAMP family transporter